MAGLGVVVHSYNLLGIQMYLGQAKQSQEKFISAAQLGHLQKSNVHG